jgi:hypothetical protein
VDYLLNILIKDTHRFYLFFIFLELLLITILKLLYAKIGMFNSSLEMLYLCTLFTLPSRRTFLVYFDVKEELSSLNIFNFCV